MEQLARIQARIASLHDLHDLVGMMRTLAASRIEEARRALAGIRSYLDVVTGAIGQAAALDHGDGRAPVAVPGKAERTVVVFCSEHGFAGAFNERLLDSAETGIAAGRGRLGIVGARGAALAEERGLPITWTLPMATHMGGVVGSARCVASALADATAADVVFARYETGGRFDIVTQALLPLDPALFAHGETATPPLHYLPCDVLLDRLAEEYVFAELTRAATESLASENGARLGAMEAAAHNIEDKLGQLREQERSLRQEAITTEMLDVVTGAEAILHPDG